LGGRPSRARKSYKNIKNETFYQEKFAIYESKLLGEIGVFNVVLGMYGVRGRPINFTGPQMELFTSL